MPQRHPNGWLENVEDAFVMSGRSDDLLKKWSDKVMELATIEKRKQDLRQERSQSSNDRYSTSDRYQQSSFAPPTPATEQPPFHFPPPLPRHNSEEDDDQSPELGYRSGRTTPSIGSTATHMSQSFSSASGRRVQSQQAAPVSRAELRARAMTEDQFGPSMTQWRSQQPPPLPRMGSGMSAMSTMSAASEASFGQAPPTSARGLRQMSSSRLGRSEEVDEDSPTETSYSQSGYSRFAPSRGMTRTPSQGIQPSVPYPHPPPLRMRSASSPNVYQEPKVMAAPLPPIPNSAWEEQSPKSQAMAPPSIAASSSTTLVGGTAYFTKRISGSMSGGGKRSSGESHSTETSDSSQQSPATPYGNVPGSVPSVSRQSSQDAVSGLPSMGTGNMLVKVRCGEDHFVIGMAGDVDFATFYNKVSKKIKMCARGSVMSDNIHIKWVDLDDDEVSIRCNADLEAMFGEIRDSGINTVNIIAR